MPEFKYTPDKEQKVHGSGAISLICKPFQSHENGLPEWAKNAADAYMRDEAIQGEAKPKRRVIVLLFCDRKSRGKPSIGCLDLVGTGSEEIERFFRHWASPDAAAQDIDFNPQGGHGNGGKCYMTQLFADHALFHTVLNGKGCRYGVAGGSTHFGYVPNTEEGREYDVLDMRAELDNALQELGSGVDGLPEAAQNAFEKEEGFTLVRGVGPKYYERKIPVADLISQVRDHTQMLTTLEYCDVYVLYNGRPFRDGNPLKPSEVKPIKGAEQPRLITIPEVLKDPIDDTEHSTTGNGACTPGRLILSTSNTSMRWKKKSRHTVNYKSTSGFIGYKSMLDFPIQSVYQDKIYGECELEALEPFKQNNRALLAEAPLTRAVDNFIAEQVEAYAQEFEKQDKKDYSKKERNALSQMNEALDRWKNRFLKDFVEGAFGLGGGGPKGGLSLPAGKPTRIELSTTYSRLGIGVAIRPRVRFFDATGKQVRPLPFRWVSEDNNVAMVDDDLMLINSFYQGQTVIYAETIDGKLQSNRVPVQVLRIRSIRVEPEEVEVRMGSRIQLKAVCTTSTGEESDDVALIWTEANVSIARVSANGMVFGSGTGETEVVAGDDNAVSAKGATVKVVEGDGVGTGGGSGGKGSGKQRGRGYPLILVSGEIDLDPDTEEYVHFGPDYPPVWQRPQDSDRNIWWINSSAPLATMYLDNELGYGYDTREWRIYHVERLIEIITQIAMTYDPQVEGPITVGEYFLYSADKAAEIQTAMVDQLSYFIKDGEISDIR